MVAKTVKSKPKTKDPSKKKQALEKVEKAEVPAPESEDKMEVEEATENYPGDVGATHTVLVRNLPKDTRRSRLAKIFFPYGKLMFIHFVTPDANTVNAYVVLDSAESANKALALNGTKFEANAIFVQKPRDQHIPLSARKPIVEKKYVIGNSDNTVFVQNLKKSSTSFALRKFFEGCGELEYVKLMKNRITQVSKGKAFVCFKNPESVKSALELNGTMFDDQPIQIETYLMNTNKPITPDPKQVKSKKPELKKKIHKKVASKE